MSKPNHHVLALSYYLQVMLTTVVENILSKDVENARQVVDALEDMGVAGISELSQNFWDRIDAIYGKLEGAMNDWTPDPDSPSESAERIRCWQNAKAIVQEFCL